MKSFFSFKAHFESEMPDPNPSSLFGWLCSDSSHLYIEYLTAASNEELAQKFLSFQRYASCMNLRCLLREVSDLPGC